MAETKQQAKDICNLVFGSEGQEEEQILDFIEKKYIPFKNAGYTDTQNKLTKDELAIAQHIKTVENPPVPVEGKGPIPKAVCAYVIKNAKESVKKEVTLMFDLSCFQGIPSARLQMMHKTARKTLKKLEESNCKRKKFTRRHKIRNSLNNAIASQSENVCATRIKEARDYANESHSHSHVLPDIQKMLGEAADL